ncbi:unnamed protein product [Bubo scandiacus]
MTESPGECESVAPPRAPPRRPRGRARQQDAAVEAVAVPADAAAEQERGEPLPAAGGGGAGPGAPPRPPRGHTASSSTSLRSIAPASCAGSSSQATPGRACGARRARPACTSGAPRGSRTSSALAKDGTPPLFAAISARPCCCRSRGAPRRVSPPQVSPPPWPRLHPGARQHPPCGPGAVLGAVGPCWGPWGRGPGAVLGAGPGAVGPGRGPCWGPGRERGAVLGAVGPCWGPWGRAGGRGAGPGPWGRAGCVRRLPGGRRGGTGPPCSPTWLSTSSCPRSSRTWRCSPGDRVTLVDDSNEEWWKGKVGDRLGFFPANFVQRVRPGESVWRSCRNVPGDREQGRLSLRENQICVGVGRTQGLVRVTSGRKRGLVPAEALTEI